LLLGLCLSGALWADTVWLDNGDRLTGKIVLMDGGKLVLKTRYAGQVTIDWKDIDTLRSEKPLLVKRNLTETLASERLEAAGTGMVRVVNGKEVVMPLADIHQLIPPRPLIEDRVWEGNLDAKLDLERNEDETDEFKIKGDTRVSHGLWRHGIAVEYDHETKDDERKTDRVELGYDLDRFITRQFFWQGQLKYSHDRIEDLRTQRTVGTGPGYQFWDDELGAFSLGSLVNRNDYVFADGSSEHFNSAAMEWDYKRYLYGKNLELYSQGELGAPFVDEIDYIIDTEAGLRYKLNSWAALTLKAEWDKVSAEHGDTNERRYVIGLGVGW